MPTVLSVTMAIGSHRLSQQGAITKRMTEIEEMAGMDLLCNDKTGTLTLNKLTVDKNMIEEVPAGTKYSVGNPWEFVGLLPLFDPPRHDSAKTIRRALDLGVSVKMIIGDQLAIAKETGRRLGMGTNMYPSSSLLGDTKDEVNSALPVDELIEKYSLAENWKLPCQLNMIMD